MGDSVQLLNIKMSRLSQNGEAVQAPKTEGSSSPKPNGDAKAMYQNGYQGDKGYGDWDSAVSPPTSPASPTSPSSTSDTSATSLPPTLPRAQLTNRPGSGNGSTRSKPKFIPEHDIEIPQDGSLLDFTADDMSTFLRYLGVEERIVTHVHKKGLDGKKFSKLKDSDLEALSMKNPIICHFRDKSTKEKGGKKKKLPFML